MVQRCLKGFCWVQSGHQKHRSQETSLKSHHKAVKPGERGSGVACSFINLRFRVVEK